MCVCVRVCLWCGLATVCVCYVHVCVSVVWAGPRVCVHACVCVSDCSMTGLGGGGRPREAFVLTLKGDHCSSVLFILGW